MYTILCSNALLNRPHLDRKQHCFAFVSFITVVNCTGTPLASFGHQIQNSQLHTHDTAVNHIHLLMYIKNLVLSLNGPWSTSPLHAGSWTGQRARLLWIDSSLIMSVLLQPAHRAINILPSPRKIEPSNKPFFISLHKELI